MVRCGKRTEEEKCVEADGQSWTDDESGGISVVAVVGGPVSSQQRSGLLPDKRNKHGSRWKNRKRTETDTKEKRDAKHEKEPPVLLFLCRFVESAICGREFVGFQQ